MSIGNHWREFVRRWFVPVSRVELSEIIIIGRIIRDGIPEDAQVYRLPSKPASTNSSGAVASGSGAVASGSGTVASGSGAVASGSGAVASGSGAVASGSGTVASGSGAVASGSGAVASGIGKVSDIIVYFQPSLGIGERFGLSYYKKNVDRGVVDHIVANYIINDVDACGLVSVSMGGIVIFIPWDSIVGFELSD